MDVTDFLFLTSQSLILVLLLSLPIVGVAAFVGLMVGLLQGLTQIQDQTISFALRLIASFAVLALTARWMGSELVLFTGAIFDKIAGLN